MEDHKMTKKDKLVLGITLAAIFGGVFFLGFFLGQYDPGNTGVAYQIGYGVGNYISCFVGAIIATFLTTNFKSKN